MEAPFSCRGCRGGRVDGGEHSLDGNLLLGDVHRVRQLELEARRGATTNFFSDNNRGVFSNSTTTIPTRPSSAAFPPPDDESKQQHLGLLKAFYSWRYLTRNNAHRVDLIMRYLAAYEHHGAVPVVELGRPPEEKEEEC
mmetsp:Transcript_18966/g.20425  ORF Transcript_18966/g.20425 Transcript_18966/m.20425 type:complete len:139 (-) Transcript_18966:258-674(-)